eukprot:TRINITY_DN1156_c0_g1_i2.p1 TRINITY_DN1156_c0_g1~~TRINITY_DN1156_c0_g1_i2.p1  ORF type:complete len:199 (-),score=41.86 TRINITY_DN1156_c0_g1_i2:76-672(-)
MGKIFSKNKKKTAIVINNKHMVPPKEKIPDYFKFVMVGDCHVGKSSLLLRQTDNDFYEGGFSTIGVDFKSTKIIVEDNTFNIDIYDTAGQERYRTVTCSYYRGAHGIVLAYDMTNIRSFENVRKWISDINTYGEDNSVVIVVGNKCDADTELIEVDREEAIRFCQDRGYDHLETSAKTGHNVQQAFELLTRGIRDNYV